MEKSPTKEIEIELRPGLHCAFSLNSILTFRHLLYDRLNLKEQEGRGWTIAQNKTVLTPEELILPIHELLFFMSELNSEKSFQIVPLIYETMRMTLPSGKTTEIELDSKLTLDDIIRKKLDLPPLKSDWKQWAVVHRHRRFLEKELHTPLRFLILEKLRIDTNDTLHLREFDRVRINLKLLTGEERKFQINSERTFLDILEIDLQLRPSDGFEYTISQGNVYLTFQQLYTPIETLLIECEGIDESRLFHIVRVFMKEQMN